MTRKNLPKRLIIAGGLLAAWVIWLMPSTAEAQYYHQDLSKTGYTAASHGAQNSACRSVWRGGPSYRDKAKVKWGWSFVAREARTRYRASSSRSSSRF